ncbi:aminoglycoside phosphotransferase family protein [Streptomyces sp. NPDC088725]|uniref:aminoglycoside phosphotransferase family protein n=1 Tax=Streptomyces sp. NPDC088725 TaxID=3365873 RepID=UPI0037FC4DA2
MVRCRDGKRNVGRGGRGRYPEAVTPWEREPWRESALGWTRRELSAHGLRETGPRKVRLRPWSVLVRLSVGDKEAVWFKANPPASSFEATLTEALSRWVPEHVLKPLAVDRDRGWSLLPDGGPLFRDVLDQGPADPYAWEEPLSRYADMQRTLMSHTEEVESLGVPKAHTAALPEVFDRIVQSNGTLESADVEQLRELRPRLVDWCAELAGMGIADALDHSDLHDGQLFAPRPGRLTFFDWGDAAVTHPFCSLLVPARAARERFGPGVLPRLRDAYLEPWTSSGLTAPELRRAVSLACRLATIGRACSWCRLFPGASESANAASGAESLRWLRELSAEPLL